MGVPQNGWFIKIIKEIPAEMDDLGVPTILGNHNVTNVGETRRTQPFGNTLYHLLMVIMTWVWFILVLPIVPIFDVIPPIKNDDLGWGCFIRFFTTLLHMVVLHLLK